LIKRRRRIYLQETVTTYNFTQLYGNLGIWYAWIVNIRFASRSLFGRFPPTTRPMRSTPYPPAPCSSEAFQEMASVSSMPPAGRSLPLRCAKSSRWSESEMTGVARFQVYPASYDYAVLFAIQLRHLEKLENRDFWQLIGYH